jgi:hypothetical protein
VEYSQSPTPLPVDYLPGVVRRTFADMHPYQLYVELVRVGFGSAAAVLALSGMSARKTLLQADSNAVVLNTKTLVVPLAIMVLAQASSYRLFGRV